MSEQEKREAWLADRRTGIGGSDAAAAVGLSKWKTRLELYLDKIGELHTDENEPMRWGNLLEPVIRQEYANRTGRTVVVPQGIVRHPTVPFALFTPDGIADGSRVLQVKTARTAEGWGEPGTGDIPLEYMLQVQHEMFVAQLPVADVALLVGGSDFRLYVVDADPALQTMLIEQERDFWQCVKDSRPPAPMNSADVRRRWRVSSGAKAGATDEMIVAAYQLANIKALIKVAESLEDDLAASLQDYMADADELTGGGIPLATWKNINASRRFDLERFKDENPELYRAYLADAQPQRRFLLKVKGESCPKELLAEQTAPRLTATAH